MTGKELAAKLRANGLFGMWRGRKDIGDSSIFARKLRETIGIRRLFLRLANIWRKETLHLSDTQKIVSHPAYRQIINMGRAVLPFIFQELRRSPDHWFSALKEITGEDPVPPEDRGNITAMTEHWLNWAAKNISD